MLAQVGFVKCRLDRTEDRNGAPLSVKTRVSRFNKPSVRKYGRNEHVLYILQKTRQGHRIYDRYLIYLHLVSDVVIDC